jgi:predicted oxidoreductase
MLANGLHVNQSYNDKSIDRDGSIIDYCRLKDISIQAWSPFQMAQTALFQGAFLNNDKFPQLNAKIDEIAKKYSVSNTTIAAAWILRHPAKIQVVTGTTNAQRLKDCIKAAEITLTHEEWYEIYLAAGNSLP